ncbi:pyruvate formate lyase family protein [Qingrenia yutianensis]|uniref:Formate acetyltransferase n=1 Tax=Qingrenia yutianensis TaxID=2763676 RepID=A0A926F837_9FIRM|nr:pyruvate formate lyase family protein [Qingrenia yutianensis]MBC8595700.1 formate acetyltransferase [Qingrenia yutianensis]
MLTYADRLKAMRETKIRHTLEKKKQNGYTDLDDFGTVPITEGYEVKPWYNSSNGSFYGYDGMCENFCRVINAHEPYVDPMEMLCGRWRDMLVNYRGDVHYLPDWLKKKPKIMELMSSSTDQWSKRWDEQRFPYDELKPLQEKYNIQTGIDGDAHFACDYRIGFKLGFGGFLEKIEKYRKVNPDKKDFYDAEEKCVRAIIAFVDRHIKKIKEMIPNENRAEIKENLETMQKTCENIRLNAPKTFREACQWTAFFNCASRIYTRDGAGFQLDTLLLPYYENDVKNGILDDETAKFLIANLLLIDPHYYQISGVDENDKDMTNHLSYLILDAADSIDIACNLTVRVHENCDRNFLKKAVYYLLKNKNGWPRFCNDKALCEGYMKNGVDKKTARERIAVGCNWMCVPGKEFPMNDTVKINIAKVFEVALNEMRNEKEKSCKRLFEIYEKHLKIAIDTTAKGINLHLDHQWEVTPELIMNLMMENSIEYGEDISKCAKLYTIGVDGAGLAVVADSFGAMQTRIEEEKILTWDGLYRALDDNFANERTRLILNSAPKYCQGNTVSDKWAVALTKSWVKNIRAQKMPNGRQLVPGWFSWARTIEYGSKVGATPNGRRCGEPISHGANPNPHFRQDGAPTAQSNGIASVQCGYGNTAPLQIEFDPHVSADEKGVDTVLSLIEGHFKQGGTLININVLDGEKLMKANENPDEYPDLVVRVTGFTAYFASLSPEFRQLVVDRFLDNM